MLCDLKRPEGFGFDNLPVRVLPQGGIEPARSRPMFSDNMRPEIYTQCGLDHIDAMDLRQVLLSECPELKDSPLRPGETAETYRKRVRAVGNNAKTHPEEHPLTAKGIEHY